MKKFILASLLIPVAGLTGFNSGHPAPPNLVEVRSGKWPINLQKTADRSGTSYFLEFRDQQVMTSVVLDTLPFTNLQQLKYFGQALTVLKTGNNGDIAKFKDYSLTKAIKKFDGKWYVLKCQYGSTDFQDPEADIMINAIKGF